jgi:hypothetical protein
MINERCESGALIITSNRTFTDWPDRFSVRCSLRGSSPDSRITAHQIVITSDSSMPRDAGSRAERSDNRTPGRGGQTSSPASQASYFTPQRMARMRAPERNTLAPAGPCSELCPRGAPNEVRNRLSGNHRQPRNQRKTGFWFLTRHERTQSTSVRPSPRDELTGNSPVKSTGHRSPHRWNTANLVAGRQAKKLTGRPAREHRPSAASRSLLLIAGLRLSSVAAFVSPPRIWRSRQRRPATHQQLLQRWRSSCLAGIGKMRSVMPGNSGLRHRCRAPDPQEVAALLRNEYPGRLRDDRARAPAGLLTDRSPVALRAGRPGKLASL